MLYNLKAEFVRKQLNPLASIRCALNCSPKTAWNKLNERVQMSVSEAMKIKEEYFPDMDFEYLFASDQKSA